MNDVMKNAGQEYVCGMAAFAKVWFGLYALLLPAISFAQSQPVEPSIEDVVSGLSKPGPISCLSYCSATESRVSLSDISFAGLPVDPMNARLEFTVYNDGFERDAFASFSPLVGDLEVEPRVSLLALQGLRPFSLRLVKVHRASREPHIDGVTLKGLEPNVDYRWRIHYQSEKGWVSSDVAMCPTPVCIHDAQR